MFQLSDRCAMLRDEVMNKKEYQKYYSAQRNVYYKIGDIDAKEKGLSNIEIVSSGIERVLKNFTPVIIPGEVIVGFNFWDKEYQEYYYPDGSKEGIEILKENGVSDEDIKKFLEVRDICEYEKVDAEEFTPEEKASDYEWASVGRCIDSNHTVLGYEKILKKGFRGMLEDVFEAEKKNGELPLYEGVKKICNAAICMGKKYAEKAKELLQSNDENYKKDDLEIIIKACSRVPEYPAT